LTEWSAGRRKIGYGRFEQTASGTVSAMAGGKPLSGFTVTENSVFL
jgi:hypothetical protein